MKTYNDWNAGLNFLYVAALALVISLPGCGGGGRPSNVNSTSNSTGTAVSVAVSNMQVITVNAGPAGMRGINKLFTSITICTPGSHTSCHTIDHVLVDTGATGLRISASALPASLTLPQQSADNGDALLECMQFADGYTWGPVKKADVKLAGEWADSVVIQIVGDPQFPVVPFDCAGTGPSQVTLAQSTVNAFGANGVLGIGVFLQDCGPACVQSANAGVYYGCANTVCKPSIAGLAQQVQNPVSLLAKNNNGVVIKLPAIPAEGAAQITGELIFGIGTEMNNALGAATIFPTHASTGYITTIYKGKSYGESLIDSGSNTIFFPDSEILTCVSGFYCPNTVQMLSASNQGTNGVARSINFSVANAESLLANPGISAISALAGPNYYSRGFIWGLPFFFGRSVYTAIEGKNTSGGAGPYFAY